MSMIPLENQPRMSMVDLEELTTFMVNRRIQHLCFNGTTVSLHESAFYPERSESEVPSSPRVTPPSLDESPQDRLRREYRENTSIAKGK